MTPPRESAPQERRHRLHYVCKFCGASVARYPIRAAEPVTFTVCERPECRRAAADQYRAS